MRAHLHCQPLPLIEESPQISQRTLDVVVLIEKKLSTIETSFQKVASLYLNQSLSLFIIAQ